MSLDFLITGSMVLRDSCILILMLCGSTFSLLVSISFMISFSALL